MENKIKEIKKVYAEQKDGEWVVFSKNEEVMEWTKMLGSIGIVVIEDKNLSNEDMIEIGNHFMATGKAIKQAVELKEMMEQITKFSNEDDDETSGEA